MKFGCLVLASKSTVAPVENFRTAVEHRRGRRPEGSLFINRQDRFVYRRIGKATVYRTVRLLCRLGLASERRFGDGRAVYEPLEPRRRHDHMVCERCGSATEFRSGEIERLHERIAGQEGFRITRRRLDLYGVCSRCARAKDGVAPSRTPHGS